MTGSEKENKDTRAPYEPPKLLNLGGGVAHAATVGCGPGGSPTGTECKGGAAALVTQCKPGGSAGSSCTQGQAAAGGICRTGSSASGRCQAGGSPGV